MLSFQPSLSSNTLDQQTKTNKRKWDDIYLDHHNNTKKTSTASLSSSVIDLHLETPLPSEWQRCLDIESGEIHFYNTRTKKRTGRDPRPSVIDSRALSDMSLDLELNLPCGYPHHNKRAPSLIKGNNSSTKPTTLSLFTNEEQEEMVAAACKRCHMLVVLCKSSPACPNCKFMHPLDQPLAPKLLINPGLGLSC